MPRQHQGAHVDEVDISPDAIEASRAMFGDRWHTNHAIIVDGFLLLTDARVMARLDVCVLITASKETLAQRRAARTGYVTLEGFWQDPPGYFDKIVWPNYLRYHQWILEKISDAKSTCPIELDDPQLLVVNTEEASPETVLHQLVQYITQRI
jgi:nicotinamide/nicotinate riboside kinase